MAGGLVNTGQQVGGGLGLAALASISAAVNGPELAEAAGGTAQLAGYRAAFLAAATIAALGLLVAAVFVRGGVGRPTGR